MFRKYPKARYAIFGLGISAVGFLAAFLIDQNSTVFNFYRTASAVGNTEEQTPISSFTEKVGSIFGTGDQLKAIGQPWGKVEGLTMFRGSPTRTYYGKGPLPAEPQVLWRYPNGDNAKPMCSFSEAEGTTKQWCGSGWTGQPVVWERPDGITEVIFGAYDGAVHFVNAKTGKDTRPKFQTGDLIKGSVTLDPDGYPLLYFGSRDNNLRILSLDGDPTLPPKEVWRLNADIVKGKWNNDWDGNPVVINDMLFEGGENSWFFVVKINRSYMSDENGVKKVVVAPNIIFKTPGYNDELIKNVGDEDVSIEDSVTFFGDRVYFANSGGRVLGLDISHVADGVAPIVFDFWTGDDTDATIVVDDKGMLYVSSELERNTARSLKLGQLMKLNPYTSGDPYIWGIHVPKEHFDKGGIWATPAIFGDYLYATTHTGKLLTIERETGTITSTEDAGFHAWSSPNVIDGKLLIGICVPGGLRQYSLNDPAHPKMTNDMLLASGACIESTPAIWKGQIFVGARDGYFYSFGDK
jgi:hypothetical protein